MLDAITKQQNREYYVVDVLGMSQTFVLEVVLETLHVVPGEYRLN